MTHATTQLQNLIESFVTDIIALQREVVLGAVENAFSTLTIDTRQPAGQIAAIPALSQKPRARRRPGDGTTRTPRALVRLVEQLATEVRRQPGSGIAQISRSLGTSTIELALPIKKLLAAGRITKQGQRRQTAYYPV